MTDMTSPSAILTVPELPSCPEQIIRLLASRPQLDEGTRTHVYSHLDTLVFSAMQSGDLEAVLDLLRQLRAQRAA